MIGISYHQVEDIGQGSKVMCTSESVEMKINAIPNGPEDKDQGMAEHISEKSCFERDASLDLPKVSEIKKLSLFGYMFFATIPTLERKLAILASSNPNAVIVLDFSDAHRVETSIVNLFQRKARELASSKPPKLVFLLGFNPESSIHADFERGGVACQWAVEEISSLKAALWFQKQGKLTVMNSLSDVQWLVRLQSDPPNPYDAVRAPKTRHSWGRASVMNMMSQTWSDFRASATLALSKRNIPSFGIKESSRPGCDDAA
ncbi:MAG: hypothetical protein M1820_001737 [Bogoriella megaspora]|nr:MAG: hypothetical protein M1820_001737 [Bogoriella megaspora]